MKRKKIIYDLIISSDWHLMEKQPICRTDDFWKAQWGKVHQIIALQDKYECPIFLAGDLFEHWKTSPLLLNKCLTTFPHSIHTIIGNHDQPQHNMDLMNKSGLQTLFEAESIKHIPNQGDFGKEVDHTWKAVKVRGRKVYLVHVLTFKDKAPWPGCKAPECHELFDWFPDADLIITGDNHKTFTARKGGRLLVNPGSLTRHKADQAQHKPCVFLYNAKLNTLKTKYLEIEKNVISRVHIDSVKAKDKRVTAFIEKLDKGWDISLSFNDNLTRAVNLNEIPKRIVQIIEGWKNEIT